MTTTSKTQRTTSPTPNQNATTNAITQTLTTLATTPQSNLYLPALQSVLNTFPTSSSSKSNSSSSENNNNTNDAQSNFLSNLSQLTKSTSTKLLSETPTYIHLSPKDSAPQLSFSYDKLTIRGAYRGYRMSRGSHGISNGNWYFEVLILDPPKVSEVVNALPKNVRLGGSLKEGLRVGMMKEREEMRAALLKQRQQLSQQHHQQQHLQQQNMATNQSKDLTEGGTGYSKVGTEDSKKKKRKLVPPPSNDQSSSTNNQSSNTHPQSVSGHLRIGFSMRTGELQAPVGYDQWSYAYRDISGSRVHNSQREDKWGGESFGPGDVVGFAICLNDDNQNMNNSSIGNNANNTAGTTGTGITINTGIGSMNTNQSNSQQTNSNANSANSSSKTNNSTTTKNHIRFFKNGEGQGHFIVSRGTRTGGEAFEDIPKGMYYPAISPYMGGAARVNFGPYFIHPPRGLPSGMKVKPLSDVCPVPPKVDDVIEMFKREKVFGKKVDESIVNILHDAIRVEAGMRYENYQKRLEKNVMEVRDGRNARGLSTSDLPVFKKKKEDSLDYDRKAENSGDNSFR